MADQAGAGARLPRQYRNCLLAEMALQKASSDPEGVAIYLEGQPPITFGGIVDEARRLAGGLRDLGFEKGDVISFQLPNWREAVALDIAASLLGLVVNPIIPIYRDREVEFILQDTRARAILVPEQFRGFDFVAMIDNLRPGLPDLEQVIVVRGDTHHAGTVNYADLLACEPVTSIAEGVSPDDVKIVMYTSGTTGRAKAVRHSHNTLTRALDNGCEAWSLGPDDVMLMPSPVTHITGFVNGIELPFFSDARSAFMERWEVGQAIDLIQGVGATACVSATPFLQELVQRAEETGVRLPSLRLFACGGALVPPALIQRAGEVLERCRAFRVYGSTESPLVTVGFVGDDEVHLAATTDGRIHNWDVRILDDDDNALPGGADGEIVVAGPALMLGYGDPEQTRESMTPDGYFRTGDIGHITPENAIVITDRKKDIIIRGGENLSAREIEEVLYSHPEIIEAAAVAMPHERLGEGVCAYVVLVAGAALSTLEELKPFLAQCRLAKQKWPERLEIATELPKTASGKVRKDLLRAQLSATDAKKAG
ncbi:AMP-binding protein [Parahaliea aestuarii]|nr:AMP-binding protein [Parahaliea aestuarii]